MEAVRDNHPVGAFYWVVEGAEQSGRWWVRFKDSWPLLGEWKAIARLFSREGRRRGEETMWRWHGGSSGTAEGTWRGGSGGNRKW
jgi:hypothetical protein